MRIDRLLLNALALTLLMGSALAAPTPREARAQATDLALPRDGRRRASCASSASTGG